MLPHGGAPATRPSPAQQLYDLLRRRLRPGAARAPQDALSWCTPCLVRAVALPLQDRGQTARVELWLAGDAGLYEVPRHYTIGGHAVAIDAHATGLPCAQNARISNAGLDIRRDGMLSAIVRDRLQQDRYYLLSCGHVLAGSARARKGDRIEVSVGNRIAGFGTLEDWSPVLSGSVKQVGIDAGIVRIGFDPFEALPHDLLPRGVSSSYRLNHEVVLKVDDGIPGRLRTRWSGYLDIAGTERLQDYYLEDAIGYLLDPAPKAGDSGAAVWNPESQLVGIHVGAPGGDERWRSNAILCPIDKIMAWFDIEPMLADGSAFSTIPGDAALAVRPAIPGTTPLSENVVSGMPAVPSVPAVPAVPAAPIAPVAPAAPVTLSVAAGDDIDVVAMTLWGEARGEGDTGMEAVACVIGNRMKRPRRFGRGFIGVCRQRWQFSCWNENDPNRIRLDAVRRNPDAAYRSAAAIAGRLVRNELADFTFGADHFYAVSMPSRPRWARNKEPCYRLGKHLFFNNID